MSKDADSALFDLLGLLRAQDYGFVAPTPASHARVIARPGTTQAHDLRGALGWSLPFASGAIHVGVENLLRQAGMVLEQNGHLRSAVRVSSLHDQLFLHSAYPTDAPDAVFLGPDSYRFANLIITELEREPLRVGAHIVDIGAGAGVGGIVAALAIEGARVTLTDLNRKALRLARINARAAGVEVETVLGPTLDRVDDPIDLAVINPPYLIDASNRAYRDGGGCYGGQVALDLTRMAAQRLVSGGKLILYTGAAIVDGRNLICEAVAQMADEIGLGFACRELDPDVFGEELDNPAYADVDRIALIGVVLKREP